MEQNSISSDGSCAFSAEEKNAGHEFANSASRTPETRGSTVAAMAFTAMTQKYNFETKLSARKSTFTDISVVEFTEHKRSMGMENKRQSLDDYLGQTYSTEFIADVEDEVNRARRSAIIATDHDRYWEDCRLPGWAFYRAKNGNTFVGINNKNGVTVEGESESEVQEAAHEAETLISKDKTGTDSTD